MARTESVRKATTLLMSIQRKARIMPRNKPNFFPLPSTEGRDSQRTTNEKHKIPLEDWNDYLDVPDIAPEEIAPEEMTLK